MYGAVGDPGMHALLSVQFPSFSCSFWQKFGWLVPPPTFGLEVPAWKIQDPPLRFICKQYTETGSTCQLNFAIYKHRIGVRTRQMLLKSYQSSDKFTFIIRTDSHRRHVVYTSFRDICGDFPIW